MQVTGGDTDVTTYFALRLTANGTAATGLTVTDFDLQYVRSGAAPSAKVDATALAATDSAHADNKAIEIDATDQPGLYRVDWPDAAFAAGVAEVVLTVKVATAFTEHLAVQIDPPVDVTKWAGTAVTLGNGAPDVNIASTDDIDLSATQKASVNTEADNAIETYGLDHLVAASVAGGDIVDNSIIAKLVSKDATADWDDFVNTTDSLQALRDSIANIVWDEELTGGTHNVPASAGRRLRGIQEFQGYEDGAIWIDTVNGVAGTTDFENGTVENPVDSIADANTLATSLGMNRFRVASGSSITFAASQANDTFTGNNWTLALGGQVANGLTVHGATVSGVMAGTGATQVFRTCLMGVCSLIKGTIMFDCGWSGTHTVVEAGDFIYAHCVSTIAGVSTPTFDFGAAVGNTNLNMRNYSGGVQLESMGDTGTDTASIEGQGQIIEGTCTGGVVAVRGPFTVSGITNLTLSDDARIDVDQINTEVDTAISDAALATAANLATVDTVVDAIKAKTDNLPSDPADQSLIIAATDAIVADTEDIQSRLPATLVGGRMDADVGAKTGNVALSAQEKLDVNAEADTAIGDAALATAANLATVDGVADAIFVDTGTTLPATLATLDGKIDTVDGIVDGILADTGTDGVKLNATQPAGWAANLVASAGQIIKATVDTVVNGHTPTTTEFQADDITEATADHFNGRAVIFTSGNLDGQATDITDYAAVGGIGQFTVTAMSEAPANNDTFVIV